MCVYGSSLHTWLAAVVTCFSFHGLDMVTIIPSHTTIILHVYVTLALSLDPLPANQCCIEKLVVVGIGPENQAT